MKNKILELRAAGKSYNEISNELGCSKGTISYHLGPGQKEKTLSRTYAKANKIRRYLQDLKTEAVCMDCGEDYPHYMMDFDHRPGEEKLMNVSMIKSFSSMEKVVAEVNKCDIVCANCHRSRTWNRKQG